MEWKHNISQGFKLELKIIIELQRINVTGRGVRYIKFLDVGLPKKMIK